MIFVLGFLFFGSLVFVNNVAWTKLVEKCPSDDLMWQKEADKITCPSRQSYDCLRLGNTNTFVETCFQEVSFVKGTFPKMYFNGKRDAVHCPDDRYQNDSYRSNHPGLDMCPFQKSICNGVGQVTNFMNLTYEDNTCSCKEGFAFMYTTLAETFCRPGFENCTCYSNDTTIDIQSYPEMESPVKRWITYIGVPAGIVITVVLISCMVYWGMRKCRRTASRMKEISSKNVTKGKWCRTARCIEEISIKNETKDTSEQDESSESTDKDVQRMKAVTYKKAMSGLPDSAAAEAMLPVESQIDDLDFSPKMSKTSQSTTIYTGK